MTTHDERLDTGSEHDWSADGRDTLGRPEDEQQEGTTATAAPMGRVGSPLGQESTSARFHFWVPRGKLVEKTHLVVTSSHVGGHSLTFYGVVEEVYRRSRQRGMDGEVDLYDGDLAYTPPFETDGVTFAETTILRTEPPLLTPPLERSDVFLADEAAARLAYGYDEMQEDGTDWGLPIGLLRNGGAGMLGPARIDLRDLCGDRAGHLNVTGQAGRGTKSSFLLVVVRALIDRARAWDNGDPNRAPFSVRPIVFNAKGDDLMYIDAPNRLLTLDNRNLWTKMGVEPRPFGKAEFYAPCRAGGGPVNRGEARVCRPVPPERQTKPYFWTLADVVRFGLWRYLFSEDALTSEPLTALTEHVLEVISESCPVSKDFPLGVRLRRGDGQDGRKLPESFAGLRGWLRDALDKDASPPHIVRDGGVHAHGTCRALLSRLGLILDEEGRAIFSMDAGHGRPLDVIADGTTDPLVIDIAMLPAALRRFVVAAVLQQVKDKQITRRTRGQVYFLVLDELGLYAPRGARDPITRLFEHVAAQLRSQGIILLGAQQQASRVSETIFGNSEVKALGATSPMELESGTWNRLLSPTQKTRALVLRPEEKLVHTTGHWMNVVVPFPAWAMKLSEVDSPAWRTPASGVSTNATQAPKGQDDRTAGPAVFSLNPPTD